MEKKHRCKLCFRNFANGRALGGHMRSHMMKFYAEEKASKHENGDDDDFADHDFQSLNSYSLPSSSSSEEEEEEYEEEEEEEVREAAVRGYELRENPKKSAIMADHDFSSAVVVQGGESETESSEKMNPICRRRSKRTRISDFDVFRVKKKSKLLEEEEDEEEEGKGNIVNEQSSPVSSISDFTPEENVAHCLIMLSKDKWEKKKLKKVERENHQDDEEEESKKFDAKMVKNKFRGKYRCEECNKLFRSYQALGGHRASHKKIKAAAVTAPPPQPAEKNVVGAKVHQCPFCDRIFSSGQALGGHKRSHFIGAGAIPSNYNPIEKSSRISQVFSIDLNLPAPVEDDEGSQIAISAVSDAEFVADVKQ